MHDVGGAPTNAPTAESGQSTVEHATDKVQEKTQQAAQQVQQGAQEARFQARERVREQLDTRSTDAGRQLRSAAGAIRRSGEDLRTQGEDQPARVTDAVADRAERLGDYLTRANTDDILRDIESFARRQPWLFATGGALVGFLGARLLKASSTSRYSGAGRDSSIDYTPPYDYRSAPAPDPTVSRDAGVVGGAAPYGDVPATTSSGVWQGAGGGGHDGVDDR